MKQVTWNYRVVKETVEGGVRYAIHEVYWGGEDDEVIAWTTNPVSLAEFFDPECHNSCPIDELRTMLERCLKALDKPVINGDTVLKEEDQDGV